MGDTVRAHGELRYSQEQARLRDEESASYRLKWRAIMNPIELDGSMAINHGPRLDNLLTSGYCSTLLR